MFPTGYHPQDITHRILPTGYYPNTLTHAGESLKKAVKEGRVKLADLPHPRKRPRGQTRGQARLVACQPPNDIDLRTAFVVGVAGAYCMELKLIKGTLACSAVLGYLSDTKVLNRILGNVKVKFEKLHNRKHLHKAAGDIHEFIHDGDESDVRRKVLLYRNMAGAMHSNEVTHWICCVPTGYHPQDITHRTCCAPHRISPTGHVVFPTGVGDGLPHRATPGSCRGRKGTHRRKQMGFLPLRQAGRGVHYGVQGLPFALVRQCADFPLSVYFETQGPMEGTPKEIYPPLERYRSVAGQHS